MSGAALLVLSLVGLAAGGALGATALGLRRPVDWLLGALVLATVEATLLTIAVGAALRLYEPWALLLGVALYTGTLWLVVVRSGTAWDGARAAGASAIRALRGLAWWQRLILTVAALALAWRVVLALVLPPFAFDALVYHLTIVADWVQSGRVEANGYVMCCTHYPSGAETLFAWTALFLNGDALVDSVQIVLAGVAAVAVAGLGRWSGLAPSSALTAGSLFLLTPIVLTQANTPYNDVALATFLLSAAYFSVRLLDARCFVVSQGSQAVPRSALAVLAGVSTGLALGTKTSGIVVAVVFTALVLTHVTVAARRHPELRKRLLGCAASFVAAVLFVGGWWYARNWLETGNPVWPFRVDVAGVGVFAGPATVEEYLTVPPGEERPWPVEMARSWYHDLTFWTRPDYSYEERDGGLGPLWSWLGWAAAGIFVVESARHRRDVAVNLVLPLLLVFLLLPYKWWSRFTIFLIAVGAIAIIALVDRVRPDWRRSALVWVVILLALAGVARASWQLDPAGRGAKLTMPGVLRLTVDSTRERDVGALFFPEYGFLSAIPESASVAVETDAPSIKFPYPFFGNGLDRTVTLLRAGDDRRLPAVIETAEYVVVGTDSAFDQWISARPTRYERLVDAHGVRLYRMISSYDQAA